MPQKKSSHHADHKGEVGRLRKIAGQISGIERMIEEGRYCPEIVQQIKAAQSALRAVECAIIRGHMTFCINRSAKEDSSTEFSRKLNELMELIK